MAVQSLECFAICPPGLEPLLRDELTELSIACEPQPGGVAWTGSSSTVALANLWSRIASRVVVRIASFRARTFFELERHAKKVPWGEFLTSDASVRFRVTCRKSKLYHTDAVAQRLLEAVSRAVGEVRVADADDDEETVDERAGGAQTFIVRFERDACVISADASGALLHKRGYRQAVGKAPLRETLAAAMLRASGWDPRTPLVDPMCGSGTIAIEGAMIARRIAPGASRDFAFLSWPGADRARWQLLVEHATSQVLAMAPASIAASDRDAGAIEATIANATRAGVAGDVVAIAQAISAVRPPAGAAGGTLLMNPPYGARVGDTTALRDLYAQVGNVAREHFAGWSVGMLSAEPALDAQTRLAFTERFRTTNGGIPIRCLVGRV